MIFHWKLDEDSHVWSSLCDEYELYVKRSRFGDYEYAAFFLSEENSISPCKRGYACSVTDGMDRAERFIKRED